MDRSINEKNSLCKRFRCLLKSAPAKRHSFFIIIKKYKSTTMLEISSNEKKREIPFLFQHVTPAAHTHTHISVKKNAFKTSANTASPQLFSGAICSSFSRSLSVLLPRRPRRVSAKKNDGSCARNIKSPVQRSASPHVHQALCAQHADTFRARVTLICARWLARVIMHAAAR